MDLSQKGLRERIKKVKTHEEAHALLIIARSKLEGKALRRCEKAFSERKENEHAQ
jgi:hypothetical protein